ncbi:MAG: hypothetical protein HY782_16995 [Chloroflexi bacterium]|nr:hypothetical protein [Chloroflexota bacterium]
MSATITAQDLNRLEKLYTAGFHDAFLDNALRKIIARQIARDEADLQRVNAALAEFEQQHGLATDEFAGRFQAGQMPDSGDMMEWNAFSKMRQRITARLQILRGVGAHE